MFLFRTFFLLALFTVSEIIHQPKWLSLSVIVKLILPVFTIIENCSFFISCIMIYNYSPPLVLFACCLSFLQTWIAIKFGTIDLPCYLLHLPFCSTHWRGLKHLLAEWILLSEIHFWLCVGEFCIYVCDLNGFSLRRYKH